VKLVAFVVVGLLTLAYVVAELGVAIWVGSLALLSDGFHNLSDVVSLYIAFWAVQAAKRESSDQMSYGWVRAEILGGLANGCFLLSLCLYVALESIPRFIKPQEFESGWPFIGVAACGLALNTLGTIIFAVTGMSHAHSHGGGGHGHSHGGHGHSKKKHGHGEHDEHGHDHEHEHGHEHEHKHGHDHEHEHEHEHKHEHGDGSWKGKEKEYHEHEHEGASRKAKEKDAHGHSHSSVSKDKKKKPMFDLNSWGVIIHYAGDMLSSAVVLVMGLILHFVDSEWTQYIDPTSSLLIVALILWTTVPLVRDCSMILLQSTPSEIEVGSVREELVALSDIESVHDLHIWQLTEGNFVCSLHVVVEEGTVWRSLVKKIKKIMHKHGIHSCTAQPEFVPRNHPVAAFCEENCSPGCEEDWCCKKTADNHRAQAVPNNHVQQHAYDMEPHDEEAPSRGSTLLLDEDTAQLVSLE
jgi:zinc transporter 1